MSQANIRFDYVKLKVKHVGNTFRATRTWRREKW